MRGAWRFARAMALTAKGRLPEAGVELAVLKNIVSDPALLTQVTFSTNTGYAILRIAPEVVAGEIAARRRDWDTALLHLERAVRYEDSLIYQEPPDWPAPVRQNLGAALLAAGRADEAEAVWEDLKKNPENRLGAVRPDAGAQSAGKDAEATGIEQRFQKAWKDADFTLTAARIDP